MTELREVKIVSQTKDGIIMALSCGNVKTSRGVVFKDGEIKYYNDNHTFDFFLSHSCDEWEIGDADDAIQMSMDMARLAKFVARIEYMEGLRE